MTLTDVWGFLLPSIRRGGGKCGIQNSLGMFSEGPHCSLSARTEWQSWRPSRWQSTKEIVNNRTQESRMWTRHMGLRTMRAEVYQWSQFLPGTMRFHQVMVSWTNRPVGAKLIRKWYNCWTEAHSGRSLFLRGHVAPFELCAVRMDTGNKAPSARLFWSRFNLNIY